MAAVANNPSFAKKVGVPQSVGKDFNNADKGKTFKKGGDTMAKANPFMEMIAKKKAMAAGKKSEMPMKKMAKGGMAKGGGIESKGKTKGKMITMNKGGRAC
jgi:hypothetical protein